jgi:hypothetical protein
VRKYDGTSDDSVVVVVVDLNLDDRHDVDDAGARDGFDRRLRGEGAKGRRGVRTPAGVCRGDAAGA